MTSWTQKGSLPKMSRWFSWHQVASEYLREFWASRMLFEWRFCHEMLPDPDFNGHTTNFREWRSSEQFNGLKLAYQCCSASVYESAWVIFTVSRACWTWHTQNVETVKSTWDNIAYDLRMSEQWCCDPHLLEIASFIAANNVASWRWLEEMMQNSNGLASKVFNYTVSILGNRVATLSRHSCPPFCYAGIMDAATQQQTLQQMKRDFHLLLSLEVSTAPAADQLASDLRLLFNPLVRLALSLFELNNWSVFGPTGIRHQGWFIMEAIFRRFPDSKVVEDCHQRIRNDAAGNANSRQSASHIMELVQQAMVLEGREINHVASLQKEWFLEKWSSTKTDGVQFRNFRGHAMRLDKVPLEQLFVVFELLVSCRNMLDKRHGNLDPLAGLLRSDSV